MDYSKTPAKTKTVGFVFDF